MLFRDDFKVPAASSNKIVIQIILSLLFFFLLILNFFLFKSICFAQQNRNHTPNIIYKTQTTI